MATSPETRKAGSLITPEMLDLNLTGVPEYVDALGEGGGIELGTHAPVRILGLKRSPDSELPTATEETFGEHISSRMRLPASYLVISRDERGRPICLDTESAAVKVWSPESDLELAPSFTRFLKDAERAQMHFDEAHRVLEEHVNELARRHQYNRRGAGSLPRDREWRPYRSCIQDVIVGETVVRYQPSGNCLEVDVFLTAEIPELEDLTGARALTLFILGGRALRHDARDSPHIERGRRKHPRRAASAGIAT